MLTDLLDLMPIGVRHWMWRLLGIEAGVHTLCPSLCPCDAYEDDPETPGRGGAPGGEAPTKDATR
jgi:hypothetical protein